MGAHLKAIFSRHVNVGEDDVGMNFFKLANGGIAVAHRHDVETRIHERLNDEPLNGGAVISQQNGLTHMERRAQSFFTFESTENDPLSLSRTEAALVSVGTAGWLLNIPKVFPNRLLSGCWSDGRGTATGFGGGTGILNSMRRCPASFARVEAG